MSDSEVSGRHYWAIMDDKLIVLLGCPDGAFDVCGPWEGGVAADQVLLLEEIKKPRGYESVSLYYQ